MHGNAKARDYQALKGELLPRVLESFVRLRAQADLVVVEGAGSPAEVNLRRGDIANMGFAEAADLPVIRSEEHTSELQSLMRISYAVFCLKKKNKTRKKTVTHTSYEHNKYSKSMLINSKYI